MESTEVDISILDFNIHEALLAYLIYSYFIIANLFFEIRVREMKDEIIFGFFIFRKLK